MTITSDNAAHPHARFRRFPALSPDGLLLALLWLFHAANSLLWLWRDSRLPLPIEAEHLTYALRVADVLADPSRDLASRLAAASAGNAPLFYLATAPFVWLFGRGPDAAVAVDLLFLGLWLVTTYGLARRLSVQGTGERIAPSRVHWPALAATALLSFFPLAFTSTRVYGPALAPAAVVGLAIWLLLESDHFQRRLPASAFGLVAALGWLTGPPFWAFVLVPFLLVALQAVRIPRLPAARHRRPSRNRIEWLWRRLRLAPAHWNLLLALLLAALSSPLWLATARPGGAGSRPAFASRLSLLDDYLGGFFLLLLAVGVLYGGWRLLRPREADDRWCFGLPLAWLVGGFLLGGLLVDGSLQVASSVMPLLPAAALLIVAWPVHLAAGAVATAPRGRAAAAALAGLVALVALVNFIVITWGAPPAVQRALSVEPAAVPLPLDWTGDAALLAPGRAITHQNPPRAEEWTAEAVVATIDQNCAQTSTCDVVVLACTADYEPRIFTYLVVRDGLADRLAFRWLAQDDDFYRDLLDADYLVGKSGEHGCEAAATGLGEAAASFAANLARFEEIRRSAPQFITRFRDLAEFGPLSDGSTGWVQRRIGPAVEEMDEARRIALLEHVIEVTPDGNRARQELSALMEQIGDPARAIALREEAVQRNPEDAVARVALASLYLENGRYREAIEQLQAAVEAGPESDALRKETFVKLAQAHVGLGQWEQAEAAYNRAVEVAPNDYDLRVQQGQFYVDRNRFADATAALLVARRLDSNRPDAYLVLAQAYLLRDDLERATEAFQQARDLVPDSTGPVLAWADALLAYGDVDEALVLYAQAFEIDDTDVDVYVHWIDGLLAAGNEERALGLAESLARTFAASPKALKAAGDTYRRLGRTQEAVDRYLTVLRLDPDDVTTRLTLGDLYQELGQTDEARIILRAGLNRPGGHTELLTALGDLYASQGQYELTVKSYQDALASNPSHWPAALRLSSFLLERDRPGMALEVVSAMAEQRPDVYQVWLQQGDIYRQLRRREDAVAAYRRAVALAPDLAFLHSRLGDALWEVRNYTAAEDSFQRALRLDDQQVDAYIGLGRLNRVLGKEAGEEAGGFRFLQAEDFLNRALEIEADNVTALVELGDLYAAYRLPNQAIRRYEQALSLNPAQETVRQKLYSSYLEIGRADKAVAFFEDLYRANPDDTNALRALAEAYRRAEQFDKALAAIDAFLLRRVDDVDALAARAETLRAAGRLEEAVTAYLDVGRADPAAASPHFKRGEVLADLERFDEAEAAYRQAIRLIEQSPEGPFANRYQAYTGYARLLLRMGRPGEALSVTLTIEEARPEVFQVYMTLGNVYRALGQRAEAQAAFQEALSREPESFLANSRLGDIYLESGRLDDARAAYQAALDIDPQHVEALVGLAKVIVRQPDRSPAQLREARNLLESALAVNPQSLAAQLTLGDVLLALDEPAGAADAYQAVLLLQPDHPTAFLSLGQALLAAGDVEDALASYQAAVDAAPNSAARQGRQLALAATYRSLDRLQDAEQLYLTILQVNPGNTAARIALGDLYVQLDRLQDAVAQYRLAYEADPNNAQAASQLGKAYLQLDELEQAAAVVETIQARRPDAFQAHILAALVATAQGDSEAALAAYRQAAALASDNAAVQTQLANALLAAGQVSEAAAAYNAALAIDRRYTDALVGLARAHLRQDAPAAAEATLRRAQQIAADDIAVQSTLGRVLVAIGRPAEAIPLLEAVQARRPDHPTAIQDLADAYLAVGRLEEGLALYDTLLDTQEDEATLTIARALLAAGQTDYAMQYFQRYAVSHSRDVQAQLALADAYRQAGRVELALRTYAAARRLAPLSADAAIEQGDLLAGLGRWSEAATAYRAAVRLLEGTPAGQPAGEDELAADVGLAPWQAWSGLVRAYLNLGQLNDALATAQAAERRWPDQHQLARLTGDVYRDMERYDEALQAYQRAAALAPDIALPLVRQGDVHLRLGQLAEAEAAYEAALALAPTDSEALEGLGRVYATYGAGASPTDFYRAEERLKQSLALAPDNASAHVALGDLYTAYGVPEQAIDQYRAALQFRPDHPTARSRLAAALLAAGQSEAALAEQLQRVQEAPNDVGGLIALAEIYRILERYQEAEATYRRAIELQPWDPNLFIALGDLFLEQGQPEQAIPLYRSAIEQADPASAPGLQALIQARTQSGKAYLRLGRIDEALATAQTLVAEYPAQYKGYVLLGDINASMDDLVAAQGAYERGLAVLPDSTVLRLRLGDVLLRLSLAERAETLFQQLTEDAPNEVAAYIGLARAHMALAADLPTLRFEWANDALRTALRIDPESAPALTAMGDLMLANGRPNQAVLSYQEALRVRSSAGDDSAIRRRLAEAYAANGQTDLALQEYQRVAVANPDDVGAQMELGHAYRAAGRLERALDQYRHVNRVDPGFPFAYIKQGEVLEELGRWGQALTAYRAAAAAAPDNADARFTLASAYRARSMIEEAIAEYEAGLALDPSREAARQALIELRSLGS